LSSAAPRMLPPAGVPPPRPGTGRRGRRRARARRRRGRRRRGPRRREAWGRGDCVAPARQRAAAGAPTLECRWARPSAGLPSSHSRAPPNSASATTPHPTSTDGGRPRVSGPGAMPRDGACAGPAARAPPAAPDDGLVRVGRLGGVREVARPAEAMGALARRRRREASASARLRRPRAGARHGALVAARPLNPNPPPLSAVDVAAVRRRARRRRRPRRGALGFRQLPR